MSAREEEEFLCVSCTSPAKALVKKTDGNFIKLLECPSCGALVDRYVECERSIVFMDMILQDITVYRHILFNADNFASQFYIKLAVSLMLSEGYVRWNNLAQNLGAGNGIMNNEVYMYIMCFMAFVELGMFGLVILGYSCLKHSCPKKLPVFNAVLLGQCGRLANLAAIIWYPGSSITFQVLMLVFVFVSSVQSTRAALCLGKIESFLLMTVAFSSSMISCHKLQPILLDSYHSYVRSHMYTKQQFVS
ncbi:protein ARV1-like [Penaeus japonicus]|uniref:protein ARV1-like n=1 Tax=Penaeus japonicus TaxID=27405 RepID=UPI001C70F7FE|nr:protein ARV1-like [Penaeus japonicus]